eukprot:scaffold18906_cov122-Isochrysis_galbana.AAC.4
MHDTRQYAPRRYLRLPCTLNGERPFFVLTTASTLTEEPSSGDERDEPQPPHTTTLCSLSLYYSARSTSHDSSIATNPQTTEPQHFHLCNDSTD